MLELLEEPPAVIFTTAFDEYAIKAFDAHAVDYLLKPFSPERFNQAVEKFLQKNGSPEGKKTTKDLLETVAKTEEKLDRIVVKTGTKIRIIPENDILYLEAEGDYINIHTPEGRFLKTKTMQYFEDALDQKKFVPIHRSYIIQLAQITKIEPYEKDTHTVVLKNGARLPVSRNGYAKLKQVLDF
jgi:two-component system LytT family response regulator